MRFCVIGSGSRGNMTYIETKQNKILLDAGISYRDASKRVEELDIDITKVNKIFITHEHYDHVGFIDTMAKKTNAKIYMLRDVYYGMPDRKKEKIRDLDINFIEAEARYIFDDLEVLTLRLSHDSKGILGYIFSSENKRLIYVTDTGIFPSKYEEILKTSDALIIEANHNVEMLLESSRPQDLKQRILSVYGHLSNDITCELIKRVFVKQKYIILAHVSEECNSDEALYNDIISYFPDIKERIFIAYQKVPTKVFTL